MQRLRAAGAALPFEGLPAVSSSAEPLALLLGSWQGTKLALPRVHDLKWEKNSLRMQGCVQVGGALLHRDGLRLLPLDPGAQWYKAPLN